MKKIIDWAIVALLTGVFAPLSHAGLMTYDITIPTSGSPNPAQINITLDFDFGSNTSGATAGLTVNSSNFLVDGPGVGYDYFSSFDRLTFGGVINGVGGISTNPPTNDFSLTIFNASGSPTAGTAFIHQVGPGYIVRDGPFQLVASDVSGVPTPATLALVSLGLVGLGWSSRNKKV